MRKLFMCLFVSALTLMNLAAFDHGWVLNMKANVGGSSTMPSISSSDLAKLGANKMEGMTGFVAGGSAEVGYIWDTAQSFNLPEDHAFSGVGAFGRIGIGQNYTGQVSGSYVEGKQIDVFVNVYMTPVISLGAAGKAYFLNNRLAVGLAANLKIIADTAPEYEMYSTEPGTIPSEVGTIIVDDWMMKNMNPIQGNIELFAEYNIPILDTLELILGGYGAFTLYQPKYISMPQKVLTMAEKNSNFDPRTPMNSYWLNSLDFGLTFALGFRL